MAPAMPAITLITRLRSQHSKRIFIQPELTIEFGLFNFQRVYPCESCVVSSVVERLVYTEDVGGSKPSPRTSVTSILASLGVANEEENLVLLYLSASSLLHFLLTWTRIFSARRE